MGTVIQFKHAVPEATIEQSILSSQLDAYFSALAADVQAITADVSAAERSAQTIESIILSTKNPKLRAWLLQQLNEIYHHLLRVSLDLQVAQRLIESAV
jgi:hypothetical protein